MGADAADTLNQSDCLDEVLLLCKLLNSAMVIAYKYLGIRNFLTVCVEPCMNSLFKGRMVRANRNDIAHLLLPFLSLCAVDKVVHRCYKDLTLTVEHCVRHEETL